MSHVSGMPPDVEQDAWAWASHIVSGLDIAPIWPMPVPKIDITTRAVTSRTMAETTSASVVFIINNLANR
jgi:hypothetical protein